MSTSGPAIRWVGKVKPTYFHRTLRMLVHKYAKEHFEELGDDWNKTIGDSENRILEIFRSFQSMEGRRGRPSLKAPFENMYDLYHWEVVRDGEGWIFRVGATDPDLGKELRRLEYQRRPRYEVLKKDAPVRPGRPRREDKETVEFQFGLGLGPLREAKHMHLESWDYQGPPGDDYKWQNVAPFLGRCMQIFNDAIREGERLAGRR